MAKNVDELVNNSYWKTIGLAGWALVTRILGEYSNILTNSSLFSFVEVHGKW